MAAHELKIEGVKEDPLNLDENEKKALEELRGLLVAQGPPASQFTDMAAWRFLFHYSCNTKAASEAISDYIKWRRDSKIDGYVDPTPEKTELIGKLAPFAFHGFDKEGHPLYIEKTGKMQAWAMSMLISEQEFVNSHIKGMEVVANMALESSKKLGKTIDTLTCIFDLNGLGLGVRSVLFYLKACSEIDSKYYPGKAAKILVLNAPWCVNILYPLIQQYLPTYIQKRIEVVSGDQKEALLKLIDADQLPAEYGGTCNCPNGCVAEQDCSEILAKLERRDFDDGLTRENVMAGAILKKELSCGPEGGVFTWFFESEGGYDVDFQITLLDSDNKEIKVKPKSRSITNKGSYTSKGTATLVFEWDNSFSYFNSKDIKYCLAINSLNDIPNETK